MAQAPLFKWGALYERSLGLSSRRPISELQQAPQPIYVIIQRPYYL